jgi:formate dehydrogenase major subunit
VLSVARGVGRKPIDFDWLEKNIPCQAACPAGTDIPGYLEAISHKDYEKAYRLNLRDNVFPAVLGRVCTRPCEPACRHGWEGLGDPVAICFAKRSADDFMSRQKPVALEKIFPPSGKRVAVIGSGAAGLTLARELTLWGHEVEIFERHSAPGGLMVQGIPEFRLPRDVVEREVKQVLELGVTLHCGHSVDTVSALADLQSDFDSTVLAFGALTPVLPDLPGIGSASIQHGLPFLMSVNGGARPRVGSRVLVIGGGFTAVDCTRMALRLGAKEVALVYRRTRDAMYITGHELRTMDEEGIHFKEQLAPVKFEENGDGSMSVTFARTRMGAAGADGRSGFVLDQQDTETMHADLVLLGTGQRQDWSWLPEGMREDLLNMGRSDNLFIAGDAYSGPGSLIDAVGHAKEVARKVDVFLTGESRLTDVVVVEDATSTGRTREMDALPRQPMPELDVPHRALTCEVESGLAEPESVLEAQRCYLCNIKFEIDNDLCIYCDRCLKVMPVDNCIVRVNELHHDDQGRIAGYTESSSSRNYNLLFIDQSACIRCGACAEVCPVECIPLQKVDKKTFRTEDL